MPSLRAFSGYMDSFADADEAEQDRMLQEMTQLLEVGKGLTTMKATQQATRIAGTEEARRAELHPVEMDVKSIARDEARRVFEELDADITHRRKTEAQELSLATSRATTAGAGAQWSQEREAAEVGQLQQQVQTGKLEYKTLSDNYNRLLQAYKDLETAGLVSPQFAQAAAPGIKLEEDYARMQARRDYSVATLEAASVASEAELKSMINEIHIRNPHYTVDQIEVDVELKRAQANKLRAEVKALTGDGKDKEKARQDLLEMVASATKFLDRLSQGLSVRTAAEIWSPDSPIYVQLAPYLTDKDTATDHVEQFLRVVKGILKEEHDFDYDVRAAERIIPPVPVPEFYYERGQGPRTQATPAPSTPAPAPETFKWDIDHRKILEGMQGVAPQ